MSLFWNGWIAVGLEGFPISSGLVGECTGSDRKTKVNSSLVFLFIVFRVGFLLTSGLIKDVALPINIEKRKVW